MTRACAGIKEGSGSENERRIFLININIDNIFKKRGA
jgi:hypothetical protein